MLLGAVVVFTAPDRARRQGPEPGAGARAGAGRGVAPGIEPPVVTMAAAEGPEVRLAWTWSDPRPWDRVSFAVGVSAWDPETGRFRGDEAVPVNGAGAASSYRGGGTVRGDVAYGAPGPGLYSFRIDVIARPRPVHLPAGDAGREVLWRAWKRQKVLVDGRGWSVVPVPGTRGGLRQDAANPRFAFFYELYRGPALHRDCDLACLVGWPGLVLDHHCDWVTGERTLVLSNPAPGAPGRWRLTFAWPGEDEPFAEAMVESGVG